MSSSGGPGATRAVLAGVLPVAFLVALLPAAPAGCAPPCGPIPVIVEIQLEKWKGLTFGSESSLELHGTVSYYVNIDNDGWWYDPQKNPEIQFRINKQPPWLETKVEPDHFVVPVDDLQYLSNEGGDPTQFQYYWEAPLLVTVTKLRDPTPDELAKGSRWVRSDGTSRVTISATSTSSIFMPDVFGPTMGLYEGYGVRELRFIPEIDGVKWILDGDGRLVPEDGILPNQAADANAPGPAAAIAMLAVVGSSWALRRRRA